MIGLDTVGFTFPIEPHFDTEGCTRTTMATGTPAETTRYLRKLDGGGFLGTGVGGMAWVEASLPKLLGESNVQVVDVDQGKELVRELWSEACRYVAPTDRLVVEGGLSLQVRDPDSGQVVPSVVGAAPVGRNGFRWEECELRRVDVVRDFDGVTAIGALLDGLATIRRPGRSKVRRFADAERGQAETLRVGPRTSWACTLYDKHAESPEHAAPGRLRFEARLRRDWWDSKGGQAAAGSLVRDVSDLSQRTVEAVCRERFRAVGFDREVNGAGSFASRVNAATNLSPRVKRDLVGYLAARALGVDLELSRNTERKYRKLAESLGLVLGDSLDGSFVASLDFDQGTENLEAKATDGNEQGPGNAGLF